MTNRYTVKTIEHTVGARGFRWMVNDTTRANPYASGLAVVEVSSEMFVSAEAAKTAGERWLAAHLPTAA